MKFEDIKDLMKKPEPKADTYEAGMAQNQLLKIGTHAIKIHNMLDNDAEMESWVAKKIDLASNYVKSVHGYTAGSEAGAYDDDGMSEISKMPKGTGTMQGVKEDAGEGHMSKSQLYATAKMAIELIDMINKGDDLEGWVQTKLNLAADYLQAVYHYEDYQKLNPYREELDGALMQKHAGVIQKSLDGILARETEIADVDTKPGMMRILKKRVNEVEKDIAKENRKNTDEGGMPASVIKSKQKYANMSDEELADRFKGADEKTLRQMAWRHGYGNMSSHYLDRVKNVMTGKKTATTEAEINEDPRAVGRALANLKYGKEMADAILKGKDTITLVPKAQSYISSVDQTIELLDKMYPTANRKESQETTEAELEEGRINWNALRQAKAVMPYLYDSPEARKAGVEPNPNEPNIITSVNLKQAPRPGDRLTPLPQMSPAAWQRYMDAWWRDSKTDPNAKEKIDQIKQAAADAKMPISEAELEEGIKDWAKNLAMAGVIVAGLAGVNTINNAIDNSVPAIKAMNTALEMANDADNDKLAQMIEKDLSDAKLRLSSGKDLSHVADLQEKYAKFMKTEGLAYESKLAVQLNQQLK
jgi:hypothetical protein